MLFGSIVNFTQFLFIASIAAAGLVYTAGALITKAISDSISDYTRSYYYRDFFNLESNYPIKPTPSKLSSFQRGITLLVILNAATFVMTNFLILVYWIYGIGTLLDIVTILYLIGLILLICNVSCLPFIWGMLRMQSPSLPDIMVKADFIESDIYPEPPDRP